MLVVAYYQVLQSQQWLWYYCPLGIYLIFVLVLAVADFVEGAVLEAPADRSPTRALVTVSLILLVPLLAAGAFEARQIADPDAYAIAKGDQAAGTWIDQNLPSDTVLGSWDAGVIGYYAHRRVINLDGVANSYGYYEAGRKGTVGRFLADRGMSGTVNLGTPQGAGDPTIEPFVRKTFGAGVADSLRLRMLWPFTYTGSTIGFERIPVGSTTTGGVPVPVQQARG